MRYERQRQGELIHIDVKKLGHIEAVGHCITGNRRDRPPGAAWEYLHVCIDDARGWLTAKCCPLLERPRLVRRPASRG